MRIALDTNVLAYAEGVNGAAKKRAALEIIGKLPRGSTFYRSRGWESFFTCWCVRLAVRQNGRGQQS